MLQLEREKFQATQDEKKLKEIDAEHREKTLQIDAEYSEKMLQDCLDAAEQDYWDYVKLNGTEVPSKKGVYRAPGYIWENARKKKKEAVDECHRRWDPR